MTYYIYSDQSQDNGEKFLSSHKLQGEKPAWIPRRVWVKAHQIADMGLVDAKFGHLGQMWRVSDESTRDKVYSRLNSGDDIRKRISRAGTMALLGE